MDEFYEIGAKVAEEVQEGLRQGKTFRKLREMEPAQAAHVRDIARKYMEKEPESERLHRHYSYWNGYCSRWD